MTQPRRGTGSLYRRPDSSVYWMAYYRNGKLYRESCKTDNEKKAVRMLQQRMAQIYTSTFVGPKAERVRVQDLAEDLLRDYRINGRKSKDDVDARWKLHLQPFFGHFRALQVTSELVNRYVDQRQQEGAKNATINRELAALKRMFNLGLQATPPRVPRVPHFPHLEERNVRKGFVEDDQYHRLAEGCGRIGVWMRALFECGYVYGWRGSELLNLRVHQVDFSDRTIRLDPGTTKNDDGRLVEMTQKIYQLLQGLVVGKKPEEFVFTRENGKRVREFRDSWYTICERAGLGQRLCPRCFEALNETRRCTRCRTKWRNAEIRYAGLIFHDLRRTAVRNMVRAGIPERVGMQISGHRTRSIFDRYHIVSRRDIKEAVSKIEQYRSGPKPQDEVPAENEKAPQPI